ncbi:hypothetical protein QUB16_31065 [Microcoleus sp. D3_18a_C4]
MLTQQFFTRVQLAKILNFKSDGSIKDLEKKGFLTPQVKPAKYIFNQVLFMMICKEIIDVSSLSWKYFIDVQFNRLLEINLIDCKTLSMSHYKNTSQLDFEFIDDDAMLKDLNHFLDGNVFKKLLKLKRIDNTDYEKIPSCYIYNDDDSILLIISIDRISRKLHRKCIDLNIDLSEKYSFKSTSNNAGNSMIFEHKKSVKKVESTTLH